MMPENAIDSFSFDSSILEIEFTTVKIIKHTKKGQWKLNLRALNNIVEY